MLGRNLCSKAYWQCDKNNKKLYKLASSLMGVTKENPLSECDTKEDLANQFAEFSITKIQNIRDKLDSLPVYVIYIYIYLILRTVPHLSCQSLNL